jgi:hypothetical protein
MNFAKILMAAACTFCVAGNASAQQGPSNPTNNPNSSFWSQGFSHSSQMADPAMGNPLIREGSALRQVYFALELGGMDRPNVVIAPGMAPAMVEPGGKKKGDIVATIPFRFREMGRLTQDVRSGRDGSGRIIVPAGSVGFRANVERVVEGAGIADVWCFTAAEKPNRACLFALPDGGWASASVEEAFPNVVWSPRSRRANIAEPIIASVPVAARPEHRLELRMESWTRAGLFLKAYVDGAFVEVVGLPSTASGQVELPLTGQSVSFTKGSGRDEIAIVTNGTSGNPATAGTSRQ